MTASREHHGSAAPAEPIVRIRGLRKRFTRSGGETVAALDDISLELLAGEIVVFLGASGCGKTTLLRAIAGLETPDAGDIELGGRLVFSSTRKVNVGPEQRQLSMVFQSYALWPHMTAFQNVAYPLSARSRPSLSQEEVKRKVDDALRLVGIPSLGAQYPSQLSGGQQQRVALARALVSGSRLVLFDEPLSNVDTKVREELRSELLSLQRKLGFTAVFVTHDQGEAMVLADRIAVMSAGRIEQFATPREVYFQPATPHVARFVGSANELAGTIVRRIDGKLLFVQTGIGELQGVTDDATLQAGDSVLCIARPESFRISPSPIEAANCREAVLRKSIFLGTHVEHLAEVAGTPLKIWQAYDIAARSAIGIGSTVWIGVAHDAVRVMRENEKGGSRRPSADS